MKNPIQMDDEVGDPYFRKPPYGHESIAAYTCKHDENLSQMDEDAPIKYHGFPSQTAPMERRTI